MKLLLLSVSCDIRNTISDVRRYVAQVPMSLAHLTVRNKHQMKKKRSERRKYCALAVVRRSQKFSSAADPIPGGAGRPKFNQLEMVTTCTYRPSLVKIDARYFELSW